MQIHHIVQIYMCAPNLCCHHDPRTPTLHVQRPCLPDWWPSNSPHLPWGERRLGFHSKGPLVFGIPIKFYGPQNSQDPSPCPIHVYLFGCVNQHPGLSSQYWMELKTAMPPMYQPGRVSRVKVSLRTPVIILLYIYILYTYLLEIYHIWCQLYQIEVHMMKAPCQDWHNPKSDARWRLDGPGPLPFKLGMPNSSVLSVAGTGAPKYVLLDYCHAYHLGYGQDLGASAIVVLALMSYFGTDRALDSRLGNAFVWYSSWLKTSKKTSSLHDFSKKTFGFGSKLG